MSTTLGATTTTTTSPAPPAAPATIDDTETYGKLVYCVSLGIIALLIVVVQLVVRSKLRVGALAASQRRVRLDAYHYCHSSSASAKSVQKRIIDLTVQQVTNKPSKLPQFNTRVIPSILRDGRDARKEIATMLAQARQQLPPLLGRCASMATVIAFASHHLDPLEAKRFLAIYHAVAFGVHTGDGTEGDVSSDDLLFMHKFFYNRVIVSL